MTVVTSESRLDVTLPAHSTIAELLPQLVRLSRAGHLSRDHSGWALSRLGCPPLPPGLTVTAAGLRDGEILYLDPRGGLAPARLYDDVVDAIASATQAMPGAWRPSAARLAGIAAGGVALLGATVLLMSYLSGQAAAPAGGAGVALALLFAGIGLRRRAGDPAGALACAAVGAVAAALAGMAAVAPHHPWSPAAAPLALGFAAVTVYVVLAVAFVAALPPWFGCLAVAAGLGAVAAAVTSATTVRPAQAAALAALAATALSAAGPMIAMRLARLPLPQVPSDIAAFRTAEPPALGPDVLDQTVAAQRLLTGLLGALGLVVVGSVVVLLRGDRPDQAALAGLLGLVWLLRSRSYASIPQRVVLLSAGLLSLAWLAGWLMAGHYRLAALGGALVLGAAGLVSVTIAGRGGKARRSPYGSRVMDVAEFLGLVAALPVTGLVLNLYQYIRTAV